MKILRSALRHTAAVADAAATALDDTHPVALPLAAAAVAAVTAVAFGTFLATDAGLAILSELRRRARLREPRPDAPSLRGAPTPEELAAEADLRPRTLATRLRLGSRLADLDPTLDSATRYNTSPAGALRIASRGRGMKGYLADNRITANYSTLMRYKRLANRLRRLLDLDPRLPLEWLLPASTPDQPLPPDLRAQYAAARRRLARLLRDHPNFSRLSKHVEAKLGIPKLLSARRIPKHPRRRAARHPVPIKCASVVLGDRSIRLDDSLVAATKRELHLFLKTPYLPPRLDKLRRAALAWLNAYPARPSPPAVPS